MKWFKKKRSPYQIWMEAYKPLIGPLGKPMNYIEIVQQITDMNEAQKAEYINEKVRKNLFWSVADIGAGKLAVLPGKQTGNVVAWWICDVPYTGNPEGLEIGASGTEERT